MVLSLPDGQGSGPHLKDSGSGRILGTPHDVRTTPLANPSGEPEFLSGEASCLESRRQSG